MNGRLGVMSATVSWSIAWWALAAGAAENDEFKVKRQAVYEFTEKPVVTRDGDPSTNSGRDPSTNSGRAPSTGSGRDKVTIRFASKAFCDATVAIEDAGGRIVRHLASGVLGPNAPEPFQKNSLAQAIVWDGKDDRGRYLENLAGHTVRISLGLKPRFERTLFWSPHKRLTVGKAIDGDALRICAAEAGVYVSDGTGVDSIRLFNHQGDYVRTIYPFPDAGLKQVDGLKWVEFPQDGRSLPLGAGMMHATWLTSGSSATPDDKYGYGAQFLAVRGGRIGIGFGKLNRLSADGATGGLPLEGPPLSVPVKIGREDMWLGGKDDRATPHSGAFAADGKRLYLSGYGWCGALGRAQEWLSGVTRMDFATGQPELFAGSLKQGDHGARDGQFKWAVSVATDPQGRVYVADHLNSRIQVFAADGKFIKAIAVERPVYVGVHHQTGEIYVLSWRLGSDDPASPPVRQPKYVRMGALDDPRVLAACPLNMLKGYDCERGGSSRLDGGGMQYSAALDSWSDPPTIWLAPGKGEPLMMLVERAGQLEVRRDFRRDVEAAVVRATPPIIQRQRLYVNPADGTLYVGEADAGVMKSFKQLVRIEPATGRASTIDLPFDAEDLCIDLNGQFYLRTDTLVARYDPTTWREVPWDYGEEEKRVGFSGSGDGKQASLVAGLRLPATGRPGWWHGGGLAVSAKGHLAVTCYNTAGKAVVTDTSSPTGTPEGDMKRGVKNVYLARKYVPPLYPGRDTDWQTHVWDEHGKLVCQDATPGLVNTDGIGIDKDDNLYVLATPNRVLGDKPYAIGTAGTLIKFRPGKTRVVSSWDRLPVPLEKAQRPNRPADLSGMFLHGWVDGAEWMYGGVGLANMACNCWNARPALDLFARSFAPEISHFSVAVLDSAGNLIVRVGRYGNVDDGVPLVADGGPAKTQAVGGDEVSLCFGAYLATHSDRRLFIADAGNSRIVSVRLDYHVTETASLSGKPSAK